jgi:hypothetical protein
MTTTTRKTRKASWAAVLTALLAVLGMVFGLLTFAGPATASSDPATECAGIENLVGFDKIEMSGNIGDGRTFSSGGASIIVTTVKDEDGKVEAIGGTWATTPYTVRVVVKTGSQTDGSADGFPGYSGSWTTGGQGLSHITFCYTEAPPPPPTCPADAAVHAGEVIPEGETAETYCTLPPPPPPTCPADAAVHAGEVIPEGQTAETYCTLPPPPPPPPPEPPVTPPVEETVAVTAVEPATVVAEPEAVAPVLPATVTEEPETVAVPAPATVPMPASVPAGDGSTVPQVPVALLALLALAAAAAATSGLRMAMNR